MKSLAIILQTAPYGNHTAQSGLNAALAASAMIEDLSVFFVGDGILQLKKNQSTKALKCKNQLPVYQLLTLYDVENIYIDSTALQQYSLTHNDIQHSYTRLKTTEIYQCIYSHDHLLSF
ncbi:sulfurtransferase complex subunit TusC [Piscirickettsia litoralis]|uniref:Sulfurtransferase TusC n=1 Tax=Piscirickettsia litoralis TaxID=1891921 RepID=A0ABX3A403_9GAMM|nr:sulfurtransferase complex subunit TusC [Piscirickettsia litoralis]ODN43602.1 sulfurtransferase TusC [Piscirickettsia litoralis]